MPRRSGAIAPVEPLHTPSDVSQTAKAAAASGPPDGPPGDGADRGELLRLYRQAQVPPVPVDELRPTRPEPPEADLFNAMREVPTALTECRFGGPRPGLPDSPTEHVLSYPSWLLFAEERGNSRPAAEWAIFRLAERGWVSVVWPELYRRLEPQLLQRKFDELAGRFRGRPPAGTDWDIGESGRWLEVRSTPALWEWYQAGRPPVRSVPDGRSATHPPVPSDVATLKAWCRAQADEFRRLADDTARAHAAWPLWQELAVHATNLLPPETAYRCRFDPAGMTQGLWDKYGFWWSNRHILELLDAISGRNDDPEVKRVTDTLAGCATGEATPSPSAADDAGDATASRTSGFNGPHKKADPTSAESKAGVDDKGPVDRFSALRAFAASRPLIGIERAVVDALCDAGGELKIADLGVKDGADFNNPFEQFRGAQRRLNPKLKPQGWKLKRCNNAAVFVPVKAPKRG
ncbi:MAG: hypothetical protein U0871_01960 [Gemmataceae bacterium]